MPTLCELKIKPKREGHKGYSSMRKAHLEELVKTKPEPKPKSERKRKKRKKKT